MADVTGEASILSTGEREVATYLREHPDATPAEIADARDVSEETIVKTLSRIRDKTRRAAATLAQSPYTEPVLADLDQAERQALIDELQAASDD